MSTRRQLTFISAIAAVHGVFFIWYQRPDWMTAWSDQSGYRRLGEVLAATGKFTRFPDTPTFVPEVLRTPAYPVFVAAVYRVFGVHQLAVALAQTIVFVALCLVVFGMSRLVASERVAIAAATATALFPPFPYFGALVMTELWTTLLFTGSMWMIVRAWREPTAGRFAAIGFLLAITALCRPVFVLFPVALCATGVVLMPLAGVRQRPAARQWAAMFAVFAVSMLPWFAYNYATMGRFTISPAGGVGRGLWEGGWQATWSGRVQNELTQLVSDIDDRAELDRRVTAIADREHVPAAPMLEYVHQWEDIRLIWTRPTDPYERAMARIKADQEYLRVARANLSRDTAGHLARRLARGVFVLWAGEIPFRYSTINTLPPIVIRACWLAQLAVIAMAIIGLLGLFRTGRVADAVLLAAPIVYITAVHFPLFTEARQSLPAMPVILLLAACGAGHFFFTSPETAGS